MLHETGIADDDRLVFVFRGRAAPTPSAVPDSREGHVEWHARDALPWDELVPDLRELLPHVLGPGDLAFGTIRYRPGGGDDAYELVIG